MLVQGINLPEKLLRAQAAGELVLFIGAGVSAPAPSSLPLFDELAQRVGEGTGMPRRDDESVDRYFGRLKLRGVQVHKAVAPILLDPNSRPHELHTLLTKLFPQSAPVRLVTTNFDTHLSTTLEQHFGSSVETFYAPALPLGDDFAGLVYLHGSAAKNAQQCVLTDEDFGRAYLNRAWATRFLEAMFQRYSVLFVGYRHSDPVMIYLARGLSPNSRKPRYAFTTGESQALESWNVLDVEPLIYPLGSGENPHERITHCVRDWSVELHRGLLEKAERIRAISEGQPPLEGEDADYLKFCLANIETARVFFRHASNPEWISWLEKNKFLISFFDSKRAFGDFERELGFWLIDKFFADHAQDVFAAIQRHGNRIHPEWAWRLWQRLIRRQHETNIDTVFRSGWLCFYCNLTTY
jgi:SIR2-like domain